MKTAEWNFKTSDDLRLFAQEWAPEHEPKVVVCLVHGLGEHSGRYAHVGAALTKAGYALLGFDLRGHGKSEGPRGHTPSFNAYMNDIYLFLEEATKRYPKIPHFLYGHSLGGILALDYPTYRKTDLAGVIATAPGLRNALEQQKAKLIIVRTLGSILPTLTMPSGLDPNTISRVPEVVRAYVNDPLVHDRVTLGWGRVMLGAIRYAFDHAKEFPVPLLIMHGTKDTLSFKEGSQEFASLVPKDCTLKLWEGLHHEIHNEPEQAEVFKEMIKWLDTQTKKK